MQTITILSGKGGVGKSTLTSSLAVLLAKKQKILAIDCDVDAPNLALILGIKKFSKTEKLQTMEKAKMLVKTCPDCKKHIGICSFGAISWDKKNKVPIINKLLCEGCGACTLVFPKNTVKLEKIQNAFINSAKTKYGFDIISGELKIGEAGSGGIVTKVKQKAEQLAKKQNIETMVVDSSPGIGCPVVASIQGSDYVVAVTEPTPSALNDLIRVLKVVEHFKIPYGVVINRWDINKKFTKKIKNFFKKHKIPILGKIPYDRSFVDSIVNLKPIIEYNPKYKPLFEKILKSINLKIPKI